MIKRLGSLLTISFLLAALALPVAATTTPGTGAKAPGRTLTDRDNNRISDDLQADLSSARSSDGFRVIVTFSGAGNAASARKAVGAFTVHREWKLIRGFSATMTAGQIRGLAQKAGVFRISYNGRVGLFNNSANADFGTALARTDHGVDGSGTEVCIVDTGADPGQEQLDSKAPIPFFDAVNGRTVAYDDHSHGTHVSGTAVGDGVGGAGAATYRGVAPGAGLAVAKVLDAAGFGEDQWVIDGVQWCAGRPSTRVISMSLGSPGSSDGNDPVSTAVNNAVDAGKVVVVAAGNSGDDRQTIGSPGAAAKVITVGAVAEWSSSVGAANHSEGVTLAYFSGRGPTADGRTKPDIAAPGVSITSARAGTAAGYSTSSGTSMATPFVAGTVALALAKNPAWSPATTKSMLGSTAQDRGPAGIDNDWGAGVIDGYALVAEAAAAVGYAPTGFPTNESLAGSVPNNGLWTHTFSLTDADLSIPIGITLILDGQAVCGFFCFSPEWNPDIDAKLVDPNGTVIDESICVAGDECGIGRQETLHAMPTVPGTYTVQVFPYSGSPNDGQGGSFRLDASHGPLTGGAPPPPPPPPAPKPTIHSGDLDGSRTGRKSTWTAKATVKVHTESHAVVANAIVQFSWSGATSGSGSCTTNGKGACSVSTASVSSPGSVTFTITGITRSSYDYDASQNHDPETDSSPPGTTIVVTKT